MNAIQEDQVRTSSNPAFRNLPVGRAGTTYAGFDDPYSNMPGSGQAPATTGDRPMTVDDVVIKTGASIGVALLTGLATAIWADGQLEPGGSPGLIYGAMIVSMLVGLGLALFISFKQKASAALTLGYSAVEGVFLGAVTGIFQAMLPGYSGLAMQAVLGTGVVFVTMLVVYKTGAVKVTPKLTKWIIGATMAAAGLVLINLLVSLLFGADTGLRGNGTLGIIVGIVFIGIAAFNLLLDFDNADKMIRAGMPSKWAWFAAFGLMTTLVWLYFEMIRLLWALNSSE